MNADAGIPELGALVAALLGLAGLVAYFRGTSRWHEHPARMVLRAQRAAGSLLEAPAARGGMRSRPSVPASPELTAARERLAEESADAVPPPDATRPWRAEIGWDADGPVFSARATREDGTTAVLATSPVVAWPPADEAAVQALADTVARLEARLLEAGWEPAGAGERWYARRFAWTPAGRWSSDAWRCEIAWSAGPLSSRFVAVAVAPGERRSRVLGASAPFRWGMTEGARRAHAARYAGAVEELDGRLRAAGWAPAGSGEPWYARRFTRAADDAPRELPPPP